LLPNGEVLVAGGQGETSDYLNSAELYNPATGQWTVTGLLNVGRQYHAATLLYSGCVLVTGGLASSGVTSSAELYDPNSGIWASDGELKTARDYHTANLGPNGVVVIAGGQNSSGAAVASSELFFP
jgi:N-acetylneuraminic acid mutarotase